MAPARKTSGASQNNLPSHLQSAFNEGRARYLTTQIPEGTPARLLNYSTPLSRQYVIQYIWKNCAQSLQQVYIPLNHLAIRSHIFLVVTFRSEEEAYENTLKLRGIAVPYASTPEVYVPGDLRRGLSIVVSRPVLAKLRRIAWILLSPDYFQPVASISDRLNMDQPPPKRLRAENHAVSGMSLSLPTSSAYNDASAYSPPPAGASTAQIPGGGISEQDLRVRYFGPTFNVIVCLCCGEHSHTTEACGATTCSICGVKGEHFAPACPANKLCKKCRERGHSASHCPQKLKISLSADGVVCSLCSLSGHLEENCPSIWTTFVPDPSRKDISRQIHAMCHFCASDIHWGGNCPLDRRHPRPPGSSFSAEYASKLGWEPSGENVAPPTHRSGNTRREEKVSDEEVTFLRQQVTNRKPNPASSKMTVNIKGSWANGGIGPPSSSEDEDMYSPPPASAKLPPRPVHPQGQQQGQFSIRGASQPNHQAASGRGGGNAPPQAPQNPRHFNPPPLPPGAPPAFFNQRNYQNVPPPPAVRSGQRGGGHGRNRGRGGGKRNPPGGRGQGH